METHNTKLNIAIVCDAITDYTAGSFVSARRFATILKERGHQLIFIAAKSPKNPSDGYYDGIKVYRFRSIFLPKAEKQFYISFPTVSEITRIFRDEKIDIVHVMIPTPSAWAAISAAKSLRLQIVIHSHTQPENLFLHLPKFFFFFVGILNTLFYTYLVWLYKKADMLVYPSKFAKKIFEERFKTILPCEVISNGVDIAAFKKTDTDISPFFEKFNLDKSAINFLYVGRLHPEKSLDTLLYAAEYAKKKNPNIKIWIAGEGHMSESLKYLAHTMGIDSHVSFLGKLSNDELIKAYNACDVFVLPSLAELEGMVVLEAMACGKPLIIADSKESASIYFINGNGFLFKPKDSKDLAEKMLWLADNKKEREKMGEESLKKSRKYDIHQSVDALERVYYRLIDAARQKA